jgi:hypothetical protein
MVISPRYDQYKDAWDTSVVAEVRAACGRSHADDYLLLYIDVVTRNLLYFFIRLLHGSRSRWATGTREPGSSTATSAEWTVSSSTTRRSWRRFRSLLLVRKANVHQRSLVSARFLCWFQVWGKTGEKIYGPDTGIDYRDNQMRFSLLCQVTD